MLLALFPAFKPLPACDGGELALRHLQGEGPLQLQAWGAETGGALSAPQGAGNVKQEVLCSPCKRRWRGRTSWEELPSGVSSHTTQVSTTPQCPGRLPETRHGASLKEAECELGWGSVKDPTPVCSFTAVPSACSSPGEEP